ncbi:MAG TPA: amino acid ABC transporter ATP-binding protein [Ruminococcaceae bacterium]|jgi:polar amino acid transport system ATP-binding protein|nr:amino acid ABC transporter ATP-binding protein [Oscillospiraceae bacterium]
MIEIRNLTKRFQKNIVLDHISLDINDGDVVGIIGPSGTGKSTFLRCINQLEQPEEGTIRTDDVFIDLSRKDKKQIVAWREETGMVFQSWNLFERKTALENVMEGLVVVKKMKKAEARKIAYRQLENVGLSDRAHHYPRHLSGGQQQRVAIARALAMEPKIILLDEPTSALDPELVGEVLNTIKKAAKEGYTMLLVSHEMSFVRSVANRVIFLDHGHIIEDGTPNEVFNNPKNARTKEFFAKMNILNEPEYII